MSPGGIVFGLTAQQVEQQFLLQVLTVRIGEAGVGGQLLGFEGDQTDCVFVDAVVTVLRHFSLLEAEEERCGCRPDRSA